MINSLLKIAEIFEDFESNVSRSIKQSNENICYGILKLKNTLLNFRVIINYYYNKAHKINPQMFYVDWKEQTCREIDCQYRALHEIVSDYLVNSSIVD